MVTNLSLWWQTNLYDAKLISMVANLSQWQQAYLYVDKLISMVTSVCALAAVIARWYSTLLISTSSRVRNPQLLREGEKTKKSFAFDCDQDTLA
jgi:hypothetical protein